MRTAYPTDKSRLPITSFKQKWYEASCSRNYVKGWYEDVTREGKRRKYLFETYWKDGVINIKLKIGDPAGVQFYTKAEWSGSYEAIGMPVKHRSDIKQKVKLLSTKLFKEYCDDIDFLQARIANNADLYAKISDEECIYEIYKDDEWLITRDKREYISIYTARHVGSSATAFEKERIEAEKQSERRNWINEICKPTYDDA